MLASVPCHSPCEFMCASPGVSGRPCVLGAFHPHRALESFPSVSAELGLCFTFSDFGFFFDVVDIIEKLMGSF